MIPLSAAHDFTWLRKEPGATRSRPSPENVGGRRNPSLSTPVSGSRVSCDLAIVTSPREQVPSRERTRQPASSSFEVIRRQVATLACSLTDTRSGALHFCLLTHVLPCSDGRVRLSQAQYDHGLYFSASATPIKQQRIVAQKSVTTMASRSIADLWSHSCDSDSSELSKFGAESDCAGSSRGTKGKGRMHKQYLEKRFPFVGANRCLSLLLTPNRATTRLISLPACPSRENFRQRPRTTIPA